MTAVYARELSALVCKVAIAEQDELQYMATGTSMRVWAWQCQSKDEATAMLDKASRAWGGFQSATTAIETAAQLAVIFNCMPVLVQPRANVNADDVYSAVQRQPGQVMSRGLLTNRMRNRSQSSICSAIDELVEAGRIEVSTAKHPRNGKTIETLKAV